MSSCLILAIIMKDLLRSYVSFTRTERMGIITLLLLIFIFIAVRATMQYWVKPPEINAEQVAITAKKLNQQQQETAVIAPTGKKINLNTADSLTLISLPGIGKGISHRILERRRQLGSFSNMQEVFDVYHFNEKTRKMLEERATIE